MLFFQAIEILCPSMKSDCETLKRVDLDHSFHEIYVEFVKKEKQMEELTDQVETLNLERQNMQCKFSKRIIYMTTTTGILVYVYIFLYNSFVICILGNTFILLVEKTSVS